MKRFAAFLATLLMCVSALAADLTDTFNRANVDPVDGNWAAFTEYQAGQIVSNALTKGPGGGSATLSYRTDSQVGYSLIVYGLINALGDDGQAAAIHVDQSGAQTRGYVASLYESSGAWRIEILRRNLGSFTGLLDAATGVTPSAGKALRLRRSGNDVVADFYDGASWSNLGSATDTTYTTGYDAVRIGFGATGTVDAWANYDTFATPSSGLLLRRRR